MASDLPDQNRSFAAVSFLVDGRPSSQFRFVRGHVPTFIALFNMFGLTLAANSG
jgi:hypothetical protein